MMFRTTFITAPVIEATRTYRNKFSLMINRFFATPKFVNISRKESNASIGPAVLYSFPNNNTTILVENIANGTAMIPNKIDINLYKFSIRRRYNSSPIILAPVIDGAIAVCITIGMNPNTSTIRTATEYFPSSVSPIMDPSMT